VVGFRADKFVAPVPLSAINSFLARGGASRRQATAFRRGYTHSAVCV